MEDYYDITDREEQKKFINALILKSETWLNNDNRDPETKELIQALSHNLILINLRVNDLEEGRENSQKYIDRYFIILRLALNYEDFRIRELKDLIFSF